MTAHADRDPTQTPAERAAGVAAGLAPVELLGATAERVGARAEDAGGPPRFFALLATASGTMLAGSCGRGVSRSDDGTTWTPVTGLGSAVVHDLAATGDGGILASTASGMWRSRDGGRTWDPAGLDGVAAYGISAGAHVLVGTEGHGIARSAHGGAAWDEEQGLDGLTVYRVLATDGATLAATEGHGTWRHDGTTWTATGLDGLSVYALVDLGAGTVLAGTRGQGLHRSRDRGRTWAAVGRDLPDPVVHTLVTDVDGTLLAGTGKGLHRSVDEGSSWSAVGSALANKRIFSVAGGPDALLAGSYEDVWRWDRGARTWEPVDTGLSAEEAFTLSVGPDGRLLAGTKRGVLGSRDAARSWQLVAGTAGVAAHSFCWTSTGDVLVGTVDGVLDAGHLAADPREAGLRGSWVFSISELAAGRLLAGTLGHGVHAADVTARRWRPSADGLSRPMVYDVVRTRSGRVLAATGEVIEGVKTGGVYRSDDGGRSWEATDHEPMMVYRVVETSDGRLYGGGQRCKILRSVDGGSSWSVRQPALDDTKMYCLALDRTDRLYLGAGALLLRSDDGADSWAQIGHGLDGVTVYDLVEHPDGVLAAATSAGIFRSEDDGMHFVPARSDDDVAAGRPEPGAGGT